MDVHLLITVFLAATFLVSFTLALYSVLKLIKELASSSLSSWWHSPRMRLIRLGGVTTLRRKLNDTCTICQESMEAGEKVRTLSCDHVFHCGGTDKCEGGIDHWLLSGEAMVWKSCPLCGEVPHPVLPWKRPPPSLQTSDDIGDGSPKHYRKRRRGHHGRHK